MPKDIEQGGPKESAEVSPRTEETPVNTTRDAVATLLAGDEARERGDIGAAIRAYREAGATDKLLELGDALIDRGFRDEAESVHDVASVTATGKGILRKRD